MDVPMWVWILNLVGVVSTVWFLSWRLKSKLAEVEDRHVMSGIRHRKRLEESELLQPSERVASKMAHAKPIQTTIAFAWVFGYTPCNLSEYQLKQDYNSNGRATSHARVAVARQIEPPNAPTKAGLKSLLLEETVWLTLKSSTSGSTER